MLLNTRNVLAIISSMAVIITGNVQAASYYWDINGTTSGAGGATPSGIWDGANTFWNTDSAGGIGSLNASPTTSDNLILAAGSDASGSYTLTLSGSPSAQVITVEEGTPTITSGTLTVGAAGIITVNSGRSLAIESILAGAATSLGKYGAGTLTLSGGNTFAGTFMNAAGTVTATTSTSALGAGTFTLGGGALQLTNPSASPLNFARNTTVTVSSTITSDVTDSGAGNTYTLGTLAIGAQRLNIVKGGNVNDSAAGVTFGTTTLSVSGTTFDVGSGAILTLNTLTGPAFNFWKQGNGKLTFASAGSTARTSGAMYLNAGTAVLGGTVGTSDALGTAGATLVLSSGTLDLASDLSVLAHPSTLLGSATILSDKATNPSGGITHTLGTLTSLGANTLTVGKGANVNDSAAVVAFGATTINADTTFSVGTGSKLTLNTTLGNGGYTPTFTGDGNATVTGIISGGGGMNMSVSGTLTLTVANTYTGPNTISSGTVTLGNVAGLGATGTAMLTMTGGTLNLAAVGSTLLALSGNSSSAINSSGAATLTVNPLANSTSSFAGPIGTGPTAIAVTVNGVGALTLSGNNPYSGITTLTAGQLNINNNGALGTSALAAALTLTNGIIDNTSGDAVMLTANTPVTLGGNFSFGGSGDLSFGSGILANAATPKTLNLMGANSKILTFGSWANNVASAVTTINLMPGSTSKVNLGKFVSSSGTASTLQGNGNTIVTGGIQPTAAATPFTYSSAGTLTLSGASTYTGATTFNSGTVILDATGGAATLQATTAPTFAGGTFFFKGNGSGTGQTLGNVTLNAGASSMQVVGGASGTTLTLGTLSAPASTSNNGVLDISVSGTSPVVTTTSLASGLVNGLMGARGAITFTSGGVTKFATLTTSGANNAISGLAISTSLPASGATTTANYLFDNSIPAVNTSEQCNALQLDNTSGSLQTLTINSSKTLTLTSGGLLNTSTSAFKIAGPGTLKSATGTASDLIVHNFGGALEIGAVIANGTGTSVLTVDGPGTTTLSGVNTYTGVTLASGGSVVSIGANVGLGGTATAGLTLNNGTLQTTATFSSARPITLGAGGGTIDVAAGTLTLTAANPGTGSLTKKGTGTLLLTTAASTYSGGFTYIQNGALQVGVANALPTTTMVVLGIGSNSGVLTLGTSGATFAQTVAGLFTSGSGTGNAVVGGNTANSTLTFTGSLLTPSTFAGTLGGSAGPEQNNLALTVTSGALTLSGNNTFTGGVALNPSANSAKVVLNINSANALGTGPLSFGGTAVTTGTDAIDNTDASFNGSVAGITTITLGNNLTFGGSYGLDFGTASVVSESASRTLTLGGTAPLTFGTWNITAAAQILTVNAQGTSPSLNIGTLDLNTGTAGAASIISGNANVNITTLIKATAASTPFTYSGTGALTIGGTATYGGLTTISGAGIVKLAGTGGNLPSASGLTMTAGAFDLNGQNQTVGTLTLTAPAKITNSSGTPSTFTASNVAASTGNLDGNLSGSFTLTNAAAALSGTYLNAGNLTFTGNGIGALTVSGTVLNGGNVTFNANNIQAITVSAPILNPAGGTISNSGSSSGTTTISGVLGSNVTAINNTATSPLTISGAVNINPGGLTVTQSGTGLLTLGAATINGSGNVTVIDSSTTGGNVTVTAIPSFAGNLTFQSTATSGTPGTITASGNINNAGTVSNTGSGNAMTTISGIIGPSVTSLIQNSSSSGLTLQGANTFRGDTRIMAGTLTLATVATGLQNSTLDLNASDVGTLSFGALTAATLGGLKGSRNLSLQNGSSAAVTLSVGNNGDATEYSGSLSGLGALTKIGVGTFTLSGSSANTYAGVTTVAGGSGTLLLAKSSGNAIAGGALTIGSGNNTPATVQYTGDSTDMIGTGTLTINGRGIFDFNGKTDTIGNVAIVSTGATTIDPTPIISTAGGGSLTIGTLGITPVAGFTSKINLNGGTLTLGGTVTFTAATTGQAQINGGVLSLGGTTRTFTVASGTSGNPDLDINGVISSGGVTTAGAGKLQFSGSGSNTYGTITTTGGTGSLLLNKSGTANAIGVGGLSVGTGTTVKYVGTSTDMIADAAPVTITGTGILNFNGVNDTIGNVTITATTAGTTTPVLSTAGAANVTVGSLGLTAFAGNLSQISLNGGTLTLGGNVTFTAATTGQAQISGNLDLGVATRTFTVGSGTGANQDVLIDAVISGTSVGLTKAGAGRLALAGVNTYDGPTTVNAGTLLVNSPGSLASGSDVTVANGATLGGNGIINGTVTASAGAILSPGTSSGTIGTLTLTNNSANALTLNGTSLNYDMPSSGACDLIAITGNLVLNGVNMVYLNAPNGIAEGTYTLMSYAAKTGSGSIVFPNGTTSMWNATLTVNSDTVTVTVGAGGLTTQVFWKGAVSYVWDGGDANWTKNGVASQVFADGDDVTFDDTGAAASTITSAGTVSPNSVTFNNVTNSYTVSAIIGGANTPVWKLGGGTVILSGSNIFGGGVILTSGTLQGSYVGTSIGPVTSPLGAGSLTLNAGTLQLRASGALSTTAETISFGNNTVVAGNLTIDVNRPGATSTTKTIALGTLSMGANTLNVTGTNTYGLSFGATTLSGNAIFNPTTGNLIMGAISESGGARSMTKNGTNTLTITGILSNTGGISASGGVLQLNNTANSFTGGITLSGGAALNSPDTTSTDARMYGGNTITVSSSNSTVRGFINSSGFTTMTGGITINLGATLTTSIASSSWGFNSSGVLDGSGTFVGSGTSTTGVTINFLNTGNTFTGTLQNPAANYVAGFNVASLGDGGKIQMLAVTTFSLDSTTPAPVVFSARVIELGANGTVNNNASNAARTLTINTDLTFNGAGTRTLTLGGSNTGANDFHGNITNNGALAVSLAKADAGTWTLSGTNTYSGVTTVSGGTLQIAKLVSLYNNMAASWIPANLPVASGATLALNVGGSDEFGNTDMTTFLNSSHMGGSITTTGFKTGSYLGLDTSNAGGSFALGTVIPLFGTGNVVGLKKLGTGTLILSQVNLYTGPTTVIAGKLVGVVGGSCSNSAVTVSNTVGCTLGVFVNDKTKQWTCSSLTFAGTSATLAFAFTTTPSTTLAPLKVGTGNLTFTGIPAITVDPANLVSGGIYPLIVVTTGTAPTGVPTVTIGNGLTGIVAWGGTGNKTLTLTVAGTATKVSPLKWLTNSAGTWDTSTSNWKDSATPTPNTVTYADGVVAGDSVVFDETYVTEDTTVTLDTLVNPASVTINNATRKYTISGTGGISGASGLTKSGAGILTLSTANTYGGATTISTGTLQLGNATALGTTAGSTTIASGATVDLNGQNIAEPFTITGTGIGGIGALINNSGTPAAVTGLIASGTYSVGGTGNMALSIFASSQALTKVGTGTLTLGGTADNSLFGLTVNGGIAVLGKASTTNVHALGNASSVGSGAMIQLAGSGAYQFSGGNSLTVNSGGVFDLAGMNQNFNALAGNVNLNGTGIGSGGALINSVAATTSMLTLGTGSIVLQSDSSIGGAGEIIIAGGTTPATGAISGTGSLDKIGNGRLILTANNTSSGATTISGGTLLSLAGVGCANSAVTVGDVVGATLEIRVSDNSKQWTCASLTSAGTSATLAFGFATTPNPTVAPLNVTGTLTFTGVPDITVDPANLVSGQSYPLLACGGTPPSGTPAVTIGRGLTGTTSWTGNTLYLNVSGTSTLPLKWATSISGIWDINTTANWKDGLAALVNYLEENYSASGDSVLFEDTSVSAHTTVTLNTTVKPVSVEVTNSIYNYTISGSGAISGTTGLTKSGSGTLTLSTTNTFTGGVTLNNGTLVINNAGVAGISGALGNGGTFTINGGAVDTVAAGNVNANVNPITVNADFTFAGTGALNLGTGATTLGTAAGSSRTITVSATNLTLGGAITNGTTANSLTKAGGGTLTLSGVNTYTGNTVINAGTLTIGGSGSLGNGTYAGDIINNGVLSFTTSAAQTLSGNISGSGSLNATRATSGTLTLSGNNTYTGTTTVAAVASGGIATLIVSSFDYITSGTYANHGLGSSLGAPTTIANGTIQIGQTSSASTTLKYTGPGETTDRVLNFTFNGSNARTNSIDASGSGLLKFTRAFTGSGSSAVLGLTGTGLGEVGAGITNLYTGLPVAKSGSGIWTLDGVNTYTGATAINGGAIWVPTGAGTRHASAITISNTVGCIFGVQLAAANGQWTSSSNLTVNGANSEIDIDYASTIPTSSTSQDPIKVLDLMVNGGGKLKVLGVGAISATGDYPLINFTRTGPAVADTYTGLTLSLPSNITGHLKTIANHVVLVVDAVSTISLGGSLGEVNTTYGTPSASPTSFTVSGASLTNAPGTLTVAPPSGYEVSLSSGSGYTTSLSIPYSSGTLDSTNVYVRLAATTVVGNYSGNITVSGGGDSETIATASSTVSPATLTVTADNKIRAVGASAPAFTATITGYKNSENASVVTGAPTLTTDAVTLSPEGVYTITCDTSPMSAANYTFSPVNGNLLVYGSLTWAASIGAWDIGASANWTNAVAGTLVYADALPVVFDDTPAGSGPFTVTLDTGVIPDGVTFNATKDYTITGSGTIAGAGGLTLQGAAAVTLATTNACTGATTLNAGTLALGANNALTTTNNVVLAGGALSMGSFTNTLGTLTVTSDSTLALGAGELSFADCSAVTWTAAKKLALTGTLLAKTLRFGTSASGLTYTQLSNITINGRHVIINEEGYLVAMPGSFFRFL